MGEEDLGFDWTPFSGNNRTYLHLSANNNRLKNHLRPKKVSFWNKLIPTLLAGSSMLDSEENKKESSAKSTITNNQEEESDAPAPNVWIFIALNVGLALVVLVLSICLLTTSVQLKRYKEMIRNFDHRTNIMPHRV